MIGEYEILGKKYWTIKKGCCLGIPEKEWEMIEGCVPPTPVWPAFSGD